MGPLYPSDFPRMDHWSENASQSDFRPFMDGFLYICSQARTTADRRVRDGESIHQRVCELFKPGAPIQLSAGRSITVSSSAVGPPIV